MSWLFFLSFLVGCGAEAPPAPAPVSAPAPAPAPAPEAAPAPAPAPAPEGMVAALGAYQAVLVPQPDRLVLRVKDAAGAEVAAAGEARVLLTGTGEEPQRLVLSPDGAQWAGPARVGAAPGYTAVLKLELGGQTESARWAWGEVPKPAPHTHGEGGGHDHAHDGAHGHAH